MDGSHIRKEKVAFSNEKGLRVDRALSFSLRSQYELFFVRALQLTTPENTITYNNALCLSP